MMAEIWSGEVTLDEKKLRTHLSDEFHAHNTSREITRISVMPLLSLWLIPSSVALYLCLSNFALLKLQPTQFVRRTGSTILLYILKRGGRPHGWMRYFLAAVLGDGELKSGLSQGSDVGPSDVVIGLVDNCFPLSKGGERVRQLLGS